MRALMGLACAAVALGQTAPKPAFQIADVHPSPASRFQGMQGGLLKAGRYEIRRATMLDLIKTAYGLDAETIFGGPAWLEWDHFDLVAKAPPGTSSANLRLMLQSLLADRFKLAVHKDIRPIQGFVLTVGKGKPKMKEADGTGETGCQPLPLPPPSPDYIPNNEVACHGVTMEEFAPLLRGFANAYLTSPLLDSTGLKGAWDFNLKWTSRGLLGLSSDTISVFDAVDKQLGLKLEPGKVPMPVLVVDSANEKPTPNPPAVTTALPPLPPPEFEVASVRPSPPDATMGPPGGLQPGGGRYEAHGLPMFIMISQAWDVNTLPGEQIAGAPKWLTLNSPLVDIVAKVPPTSVAGGTQLCSDDLQAMMRTLLTERFKMKTHYEDRPMDAYTLVAAKPKMKPADPSNRTGCKIERAQPPRDLADGPPPFVAVCQNVTMAQFVDRLPILAPIYLRYPVLDATGIQRAYDFSLTFMPVPPNLGGGGGGRGGTKGGGPPPAAGATPGIASDPTGGMTLFDALEKQLGLKLEKHQRPEPVFVIDHVEEKPTDN